MATMPMNTDLDMLGVSRITNLPNAAAAQEPATLGQVQALVEGNNWKDSVRAAGTANINLSAPGATIDGVTMVSGDRFLAKDQTTASQNGLYVWNGAATPAVRAIDGSTFGELEAAIVMVEEGTTNAGTRWRQTQVNGTIDTNNVVFVSDTGSAPAASETTAGVAEIATQAETDTGTDDNRFVTPLKLKTSPHARRAYATNFGDGSATSYVITHNLNTLDVQVTVKETGGNKRAVGCEVRETSVNSVTILVNQAPAAGALRAVVTA